MQKNTCVAELASLGARFSRVWDRDKAHVLTPRLKPRSRTYNVMRRGGADQRLRAALAEAKAKAAPDPPAPEERRRSRSPRRPPGGARARLAASRGANADPAPPARAPETNTFKEWLTIMLLSNKLSAGDVQIGGASGQDSGAQGVQAFTKAGASGKHPGNMHRDMMREVLKGTSLPEPYYAEAHITYVT